MGLKQNSCWINWVYTLPPFHRISGSLTPGRTEISSNVMAFWIILMFHFIFCYDTSGFKHRTKWLCILSGNGYVSLSGFKRSFYSFLVHDCHQQQQWISFLDKVPLIPSSVLAERYAYKFWETHRNQTTTIWRPDKEHEKRSHCSPEPVHFPTHAFESASISTEQMSWFH